MKIRLTILFLFLATSLFGQGFFSVVASKADNPTELIYTPIPDAPSDGTSATLTFTNPGNILNTTGGDTQNKYMDGAWTTFRAFSFAGTSDTYRRIINFDEDVVVGGGTGFLFNLAGTGSTYFGIYGRYDHAPMYFDSVGNNVATSSIQLSAQAAGPSVIVQNIVTESGGHAVFANTTGTLSGGDASTPPTSTANYGTLDLSFIRSFNVKDNEEHFYLGSTSTTAYAIHTDTHVSNVLTHTAGWDSWQIGNATDFTLTKSTFIDGGLTDQSAQNASLQVSNAYGIIDDCIFMGAPQGFRISTHELTIDNVYMQWTGNIANEIIDYYGNYNTSSRLIVNIDTVWITNSDFVSTTWTGAAFRVLDPEVIVVVSNCRFNGPTSLFQDHRIGATGALIDGGGNTFGVSIETPTFSNFTPTDWEGHGLLTEITNYLKGRGFRTP